MSAQPKLEAEQEWIPKLEDLIPEDDESVDNLFSETQQRLLTEPLYSAWVQSGQEQTFLAAANVGVYYMLGSPSIGPDVLLSLDVQVPAGFWSREQRSYYIWEYGKAPDLVIEIISKTVRGEDTTKKDIYARMRVGYYVIFDPNAYLMPEVLTVYRWDNFRYESQATADFPALGLGLTLWEGAYEGKRDRWLRWVDAVGNLIPTGQERGDREQARAEQEHTRAEQERTRADHEHARAERLAEMLRQLGRDPGTL
ncbi:MAG: Uma2 family endonuclease [Acidobacteria bacterium]|nr:Uma2 family endonuclease [Acidobacteriota bacterium]MBI3423391.1 Uma2 family endonuclease [Acidobacteriota bacterium]